MCVLQQTQRQMQRECGLLPHQDRSGVLSPENSRRSPEMVRLTLGAAQRDPSSCRPRALVAFCILAGVEGVPLWSYLAPSQLSEELVAGAHGAACCPRSQF